MNPESPKSDKNLYQINSEKRQQARDLIKQKVNVDEGWLVRLLEKVDYISWEYLSLLNWLTRLNPNWYGNMSLIESYVVGWLLAELALFAALAVLPNLANNTLLAAIAVIVLAYRWHNIITYWFHAHILSGRVSSPVRALALTLINFVEIVVIFAIIDFLLSSAFNPAFLSVPNSLDYSIRIMTTLGWDKYEPVGFGYILFYAQIFSGIGTITIVISSVMSYFTRQS